MTEPTPFDLDATIERIGRLVMLALIVWSAWDAVGEWRRRQIVAELRRLVPVVPPAEVEPSTADVDAVLRRAAELTRDAHDGMEMGPDGL